MSGPAGEPHAAGPLPRDFSRSRARKGSVPFFAVRVGRTLGRVVLHDLPAFLLVALVVVFTPGPATALVIRNALRGGTRAAWATTAGNSTGIFVWATASVLGISALVAASEAAFAVLKIVGAIVLVVIGLQSIYHARYGMPVEIEPPPRARNHYREGLLTSFANPKLAVFFLALFPQFIPEGDSVLPATVMMALIII